jgi:hypothetical protein
MTPSLQRRWSTLDDGARVVRIPLSIGDLAKGMGAFMEPSGRNAGIEPSMELSGSEHRGVAGALAAIPA